MGEHFNRIIVHWTAGGHKATPTDIKAYHYIIQGDGTKVDGSHNVWNNSFQNMSINRITGNYAHHTGGGNTGAIGVAMAGMAGYISRKSVGSYPLTKVQCEATFKLIAKLCKQFQIDPANVWTHYEFGRLHPRSGSAGKPDITYLPPYPQVSASEVGGYIRNRVRETLGYQVIKMVDSNAPRALAGSSKSKSSGITGAAANINNTSKEVYSERPTESTSSSSDSASSSNQGQPGLAPTSLKQTKELFMKKKDTSGKPLSWLRTINNWLEILPSVVTASLNNMIGTGENMAQSKIDMICAWLAYKINVGIERKRQEVIKALYAQYISNAKGPVWRVIIAIQSFVADPIGSVGSFASAIFGPVKTVIEWVIVLVKELPRLAQNLANVASTLPPTPPTPNINFDKFQIKVNSISMGEILKGPAGFKNPEDMFPKPIDPYEQDSFILFGDNSSEFVDGALKQKKYSLRPDDFEAMSSAIAQQSKSNYLDQDLTITYTSKSEVVNEINEAFRNGAARDKERSELEKSSDYFFD